MSAKVKLQIAVSKTKSKEIVFDEPDTLVFGRHKDCHMQPVGDDRISGHHFIIEFNPPDARIRDTGSLNGTYVNGTKIGGREPHETPEQGQQREYPPVDLHDGDEIRAGSLVIQVKVEADVAPVEVTRCQRCGRDVSDEVGSKRHGDYVCLNCREQVQKDPLALLAMLLQRERPQARPIARPELTLPGYDIERKLGEGGMGAVYLARNQQTGQKVALKIMLSQVAVDEHARKVFKREIDVTRELKHTNIVEFIDWGQNGGMFYFLLEFCNGSSVDKLMERQGGRLSLTEAAPLMLDALTGLAFAHAHKKQFVHRDLKPHNILLVNQNSRSIAKISDMGLSKSATTAGISGMTASGTVAGSLAYMPRDQLMNFRDTKPVSDVWGIGATYYHILTGELPRTIKFGQSPVEMVLNNEAIPIRKRDSRLPKTVADVIDRSLTMDVKHRYQNAGEMLNALKQVL